MIIRVNSRQERGRMWSRRTAMTWVALDRRRDPILRYRARKPSSNNPMFNNLAKALNRPELEHKKRPRGSHHGAAPESHNGSVLRDLGQIHNQPTRGRL